MMAMDRERAARLAWTDGTNGIIAATTGGVAVQAGIQVLKDGGNAADAAVTTALAEVVNAGGSYVSFAGVMAALYYDSATGKVYSLNAAFDRPQEEKDSLSIPETGGRTVLVPGFMAGVQAIHDRFGKVPFQDLFKPAINLAEKGEALNALLAWNIESKKDVLSRFPETKRVFTDVTGRFYSIGLLRGPDLFRQPELGVTLRKVASQGADYMYGGEWGRKFVDAIRSIGGKINMGDMKNYKVAWEEPLRSSYRDIQVFAAAPSSLGGGELIEALNLLELADLKKHGHWTNSADSLYRFIQIASCNHVLFKPAMYNGRLLTPQSRVTKETARWIWEQMQNGKWPPVTTAASGDAGGKKHSAAIVVVDRWGNMAVITHSINTDTWGATGLFVDGVSIPDSARFHKQEMQMIGSGARLFDLPSPLIFCQDGKPILGCSTIGAGREKMLQVLVNIFDFGMKPRAAIKVPAFLPSGQWHGGLIARFNKRTFNPKVLDDLRARGITVKEARFGAALQGAWVGIQIDPNNRHFSGAVSPGDSEQVEGY